ncbi:hypothetical protein PF005_g5933 [Phytophthora fragariae]|uniref:WRKY19-like zinc finger domain-containing protein n=2 Tax=Phytophthora fragariae TaxID=53985 RepID=A0A6A3YSX3_9STRA|nr:hypothetical protein PF011_g2330 [Phytophthora fragariae]KAE9224376.1 hypothetical protein PF005_g5933 [Phytophthora fragariae]
MCRPIESRDSLGAMGPAAVALFAGYQPAATGSKAMLSQNTKAGVAPAWSTAGDLGFGADAMNMLSMAAPPPALPFVSFPKTNNLPAMPWDNVAPTADLMSLGMPSDQFAAAATPAEAKPEATAAAAQPNFEAQELEELLDFSMPGDLESVSKDKPDLVNLDDGFDGTEMSILYSFLVDAPEDKLKQTAEVDDGILNLNMLAGSPIEGLMESLETDFTDTELMLTPRHPEPHMAAPKMKPGEVKSRRLCKSEGCYKRSRSNGLCISHGGGRRCAVEGCDKSSQGGNLCIRHGGGKRCSHEGCDKAAQSNFLCKAHGGGPRCQFGGCTRSSQGGGFCRSHGGGKRCMFDGCDKGTQRGDYCALHGGSRLCEVPGCMRNDRGGGLCATHGGGKRCTTEGCNKPCRRKGLCSAHLRQIEGTK